MRSSPAVLALTLAAITVCGCSRKVGGFKNKAEELEYRIEELERENRALTAERGELAAKVSELSRALDAASGTASGAVVAALPRCAALEFDRLTSLVDRDGAPGFEGVDAYLRPLDGRRRFVQVAGHLRLQVLAYPTADTTDAVPRVLAEAVLDPDQLREAYRSSMAGTHYTVSLVFQPPLGFPQEGEGPVELVAQFDDAVTGIRHLATRRLDR